MKRFSCAILGSVLALWALATSSTAQVCLGPDNLSGPCWQPTIANLPDLHGFEFPAAGLCWQSCQLAGDEDAMVQVDPPVQIMCGQYFTTIRIFDATGTLVLIGEAVLDYTRTWDELNPFLGREYQVWRYVLKADLQWVGPSPIPTCYVPTCIPFHPTAFFYGYVDWAQNCQTGEFENAITMFHNCDAYIHVPGLSDRPGSFHPTDYYAIVGPDTPANPFLPTVEIPPSGPIVAEAVRDKTLPGLPPQFCVTEEILDGGVQNLLGTGCFCPLSLTPGPQSATEPFLGMGTCPGVLTGGVSTFQALIAFPTFIWYGLVGTSLGRWTSFAAYPGEEIPFANEAFVLYKDSCLEQFGLASPFSLDLVYGGTTREGFEVVSDTPAGLPLPWNFTDLSSNYSQLLPGPFFTPILGSIRPTDHLIYTNVP